MKQQTSLILFLFFIFTSCEIATKPEPPVIGAEDVIVFQDVEITISSRTIENDRLVAEGTIKNIGTSRISPTWYFEGEFYQDNTFQFKFGGSNQSFIFSLNSNETTGWRIEFASNQYNLNTYPNFAIANMRVFKNR